MTPIFVDTVFWIAFLDLSEPLHTAAVDALKARGGHPLITTDLVMCELLNFLSRQRPEVRASGVRLVRNVQNDPHTTLVSLDEALFSAGVTLYCNRSDKSYSLTDCISMLVMRQQGIRDVLTTDHHFAQEGFRILLPTSDAP